MQISVRALTEVARAELAPFGVKAILIEPSAFTTNISNYSNMCLQLESAWRRSSQEVRDAYGKGFIQFSTDTLRISNNIGQYIDLGRNADLKPVIDAIEKAVTSPCPHSYYRVTTLLGRPLLALFFNAPREISEATYTIMSYTLFYCGKGYPSLRKNVLAKKVIDFLLNDKIWQRTAKSR